MPNCRVISFSLTCLLLAGLSCAPLQAHEDEDHTSMSTERRAELDERRANLPEEVREVYIDEHAGDIVPMGLVFRDAEGQQVQFSEFFDGDRPVLLSLNYYRCPKICDVLLEGTAELVEDLSWTLGEEYRLVTVSFDPAETPAMARMKRRMLSSKMATDKQAAIKADWSFLTGEQEAIDALTEAVGFRYTWLESNKQYAHPSALIVLSPNGKITRYIYGVTFTDRVATVRLSLVEASEGKVGSPLDLFLLTCFHYSPITGMYTATAMGMMRVGGVLTVLAIVLGIGLLLLKEYRKRRLAEAGESSGSVAAVIH